MNVEQAWIQSRCARLYANLYIPENIPSLGLVICHGLNAQGSRGLRLYRRMAETACKCGFVALVFDFRGVGRSSGVFDYGVCEQWDVKSALDYLDSRPEVKPNSIFVVGHSLGGAISLYALQNEKRAKGIAVWSAPKNHSYNVKKFVKLTRGALGLHVFLLLSRIDRVVNVRRVFELEVYGVKLRPRYVREKLMKLDECRIISKLKMPVLIAIGSADDIVGLDEAYAIYDQAGEPKTLQVIDGADHAFKGKEEDLIGKTIKWMKALEAI